MGTTSSGRIWSSADVRYSADVSLYSAYTGITEIPLLYYHRGMGAPRAACNAWLAIKYIQILDVPITTIIQKPNRGAVKHT